MTAAPVKLEWDASPDAAVTGYALYYRLVGSAVTNRLDLGVALDVTFSDLSAESYYIFSIVAYNSGGVESASSNVLWYKPPVLSRLKINKQAKGTMRVTFRAAPGAACRVEYASSAVSAQWQTLGNATADANGNVVINDPPFGRPPIRFYRAVRL